MKTTGHDNLERSPHCRAFTLIELMIVVSIIATLISILLPSLAAAREQAKVVKCLAQLRQFGTASGYYSSENEGWLPGDYWPNSQGGNLGNHNVPHILFAEALAPYLGGLKRTVPVAAQNTADSRDCLLSQMFARMPVLQCPSWPGGTDGDPNNCPSSAGSGSRRRGGNGNAGGGTSPRPREITGQVLCYAINAWDFPEEKKSLGPDGFYTGADGPGSRGLVKSEHVPRPASVIYVTEANKDNIGWTFYGWHDIFRQAHLWDSVDSRMVDDRRHVASKRVGIDRALVNSVYYDGHAATARLVSISAHDFSPYQRPPNLGGPGPGPGVSRR